jgi:hypothetical protein
MALASVNAAEYAEFHCLHTSEPGLPGPIQLSNRNRANEENRSCPMVDRNQLRIRRIAEKLLSEVAEPTGRVNANC